MIPVNPQSPRKDASCLCLQGYFRETNIAPPKEVIEQIVREIFDKNIRNTSETNGEEIIKVHEDPRRFILQDGVLVLLPKNLQTSSSDLTRVSGTFKVVTRATFFQEKGPLSVVVAKPKKSLQNPESLRFFTKEKELFDRCKNEGIKGICYPTHIFTYGCKTTGQPRHRMVFPAHWGDLFNFLVKTLKGRERQEDGRMLFQKNTTRSIQHQLLETGVSLEKAGCVHRDIKLENILITQNGNESVTVVICDIASAVFIQDDLTQLILNGTQRFLSPEYTLYFKDKTCLGKYTTSKIDVWGMGLVFLALEHCDFYADFFLQIDQQKLLKEKQKWYERGEIPMFDPLNNSTPMNILIWRMLRPRPEDRISFEEALQSLVEIRSNEQQKKP